MSSVTSFIHTCGPWGYPLTVFGLVVLILSGRGTWALIRDGGGAAAFIREQANATLFWGIASAVLGFLGQCQGTYTALNVILTASEIDPRIVIGGFLTSFFPTLFGLGIFAFALVVWMALRLPLRGRGRALLFLLLLSLALPGCRGPDLQAPEGITQGVWAMEDGSNVFLWEFTPGDVGAGDSISSGDPDRSGPRPLACVVHDFLDGLRYMETPCSQAALAGDNLTLQMPTGVRYEGTLLLGKKMIDGGLVYPDGSRMQAPLRWAPRRDFPGLEARPAGAGPYAYRQPRDSADGWSVAHPSEMGVDPGSLEALVRAVERGDAGFLKSLLVVRGGSLLLEEYFHGHGPHDLVPIRSCTKSIASLLVGLAIQEGDIDGIDAPLLGFFPEAARGAGAGWPELTLEHLLTMSMALGWSPEEEQDLHGTGPEAFRQILSRDVVGRPGQDWAYVNMNVNLLAGILHRATGEHAGAFARRTLFEPLGITDWNWDFAKRDGYNLMDGSLRLRPRDMAKIGTMVLDGGVWNGRRVVDEGWIRASLQPRMEAGAGGEEYGYLWWTMHLPGPSREALTVHFANGWGSQFILLFPELDMVVVTTGGNMENGKHLAVGQVLVEHLLSGVSSPRPSAVPGQI